MNPKERHYWTQLRAALTAGQWRTHFPAKTPSGAPLSWSELFRKFNKHCRGAHDLANVASHTYTLALFISEDSLNEDEDSDVSTLGIDAECLIPQGRVEKIEAGYEELQSLQSSNLDTIHFALAYYAYALGNPAQCIAHLEKVPDLHQVRTHLPTSLGVTPSNTNLSITQNAPSITSSFTPSFASVVDSTVPEVRDGRGLAMVEAFRSICLQGMALEHLHPTSPSIALQTYCSVLPYLFPSLKSQFPHISLLPNLGHQNHKSSSPSSKLDFTVFHQLRELWRWVERIIWRAVVLCANVYDVRKGWKGDENSNSTDQQGEEGDSLWIWLSHYAHYSVYWPSTFRTSHRSTIASIHIRALILLHRPSPSPSLSIPSSPSSPYPLLPSPLPRSFKKSPPAWLNQARQVIQDYQAILGVSTTFPRAGTRNVKVEEFVDLCVAVWEVYVFGGGRGEVGWVIDILWWATRLTFNSSRILRHMTRLLYLYGDTKLSKRTLNLYIQVVGKAYETSGHHSESDSGSCSGEDTDTDSNWVDTLIFGATMLCISSSSSSCNLTEMDDLNEAHKIIEKAKTRLNKQDKRLVAKIYLAEGVYWMMLGVKGQDPLARQTHLSLSHSLLLQSVQTDPTPSGYYHLALSYAVPGGTAAAAAQGSTCTTSNNTDSGNAKYNLDQAIQYAGLAVEADPGDVKYWHLLGLLLAAQERWEEAREVLERGADFGVGEDDADVEVNGESGELGLPSLGMRERDEEENDTVDSVQSDADVRTLLGPPISIRNPTSNGDSSTITPAIKKDGIGNISINRDPPITSTNPPQPIYIFSHSHSQSPSSSSTTSTTQSLPPTSTLLLTPPPSKYPPSQYDLFESHLQLRMTQGTVVEIVEGAEGAEALWLEVFGWVAKRRNAGDGLQRQSIDGTTQQSSDHISSSHHHTITTSIDGSHHLHPNPNPNPVAHHHNQQQTSYPTDNTEMYQTQTPATGSSDLETNVVIPMIPITISPATPTVVEEMASAFEFGKDREKEKEKEKEKDQRKDYGKEKRTLNNAFRPKRLTSLDIEGDNNNRLDVQKSKKNVGQMLKGSVMKSRAGITAATKKLGARHGGLRRSTSTPDFHVVFQQSTSYQASSIHSRRRLSFMSASRDRPFESPPPPPSATTQQPSSSPIPISVVGHHQQDFKNERSMKDRLLSDLWLMSAATFRRLGKIDQAKGAIQEAEVKDENNPAVWVQFGLYYIAIGLYQHAVDTFQKALFICPDDVAATVHLSRLYLDPDLNACLHSSTNQSSTTKSTTTTTTASSSEGETTTTDSSNPSTPLLPDSDVDLAAGMLSYLTKGKGWNVPEAWYYLAKAYGLQGRKEKEKEIFRLALELSERRGVRDIGSALGWCYL